MTFAFSSVPCPLNTHTHTHTHVQRLVEDIEYVDLCHKAAGKPNSCCNPLCQSRRFLLQWLRPSTSVWPTSQHFPARVSSPLSPGKAPPTSLSLALSRRPSRVPTFFYTEVIPVRDARFRSPLFCPGTASRSTLCLERHTSL